MSLRDITVITVIIGSLPFCFRRPWIGILVWSWIGYMNPHRLTWGVAYSMPFAQMVAIATICGMFFSKEKLSLPLGREVFLLIAMWGFFTITTIFAVQPEDAWNQYDKVSKILLMTFFTLLLINDKKRLMALTWVIVLSIGFFGFKGGIFAILTGGQFRVRGPEETFIEGNTEIGLALNMVLPLIIFLRREENRIWVSRILLAILCLSIIAILVTYSRGAFLGLIVVIVLLTLKSRAKLIVLPLLLIAMPMTINFLPEKWFSRMETIETYEEDTSAMMRICSWHVSYRIAREKPLLGAGFRPFSWDYYVQYQPEDCPLQSRSDAHSIYFQVLAEHGFVGLATYLALIIFTMMSIRQLMWTSKKNPSMRWIYNYAQMLEVSMWAYLVSGTFLSMSYFDLFFHFVAITVIIKKIARESLIRQRLPDTEISAS